jgi:hypothetical protein
VNPQLHFHARTSATDARHCRHVISRLRAYRADRNAFQALQMPTKT